MEQLAVDDELEVVLVFGAVVDDDLVEQLVVDDELEVVVVFGAVVSLLVSDVHFLRNASLNHHAASV